MLCDYAFNIIFSPCLQYNTDENAQQCTHRSHLTLMSPNSAVSATSSISCIRSEFGSVMGNFLTLSNCKSAKKSEIEYKLSTFCLQYFDISRPSSVAAKV